MLHNFFREPALHADLILQVGGQHFHAHKCILAINSGYFKSVLTAEMGRTGESSSMGTLSLPGLPPCAFSVLLDFMYSGHLALTAQNIYEVLLCAQFLHMPRAIELCKTYLVQKQLGIGLTTSTSSLAPLDYTTSKPWSDTMPNYAYPLASMPTRFNHPNSIPRIVRPIPSKQFLGPSSHLVTFDFLKPMTNTPHVHSQLHSLPIENISTNLSEASSSSNGLSISWYHNTPFTLTTGLCSLASEEKKNPMADTAKNEHNRSSEESLPLETDLHTETEDINKSNSEEREEEKEVSDSDKEESEETGPNSITSSIVQVTEGTEIFGKVILDIACCDGPVQFQRVLNENYYSKNNLDNQTDSESTVNNDTIENISECKTTNENEAPKGICPLKWKNIQTQNNYFQIHIAKEKSQTASCSFSQSTQYKPNLNSIPTEDNLDDAPLDLALNDLNQSAKEVPSNAESLEAEQYFNKSKLDSNQPYENDDSNISVTSSLLKRDEISLKSDDEDTTTSDGSGTAQQLYHCIYCNHSFKSQYCYQKHKRRHINPITFDVNKQCMKKDYKPLDMNVPFYPCKTCGCKFPSYYFVHKHRKMCHHDKSEEGN